MALFDEDVQIEPARRRAPRRRSVVIGLWSLSIALVALLALSFLPSNFVIQRPGPVYNTLGSATTAEGSEVPLIQIEGTETFPTTGALDLTTVQVIGNRDTRPSWVELAVAWFDPARAVVPLDSVFPPDQSTEERNEESAQMMVDSQQDATAAALDALGYEVTSSVRAFGVPDDSPAAGIVEADDVIVAADSVPIADVDELRAVIQEGEGAPVTLTVLREGTETDVEVTPVYSEEAAAWQVGVSIIHDYVFPIDVTIQLDNVGGPSAGMMFALGIIDTLTPGDLTDGRHIAGTGTIAADGTIGVIGGIRHKLYGSREAGAEYFLAPAGNCDEVVGHVPDGLRVFAVTTLDDAIVALEAVREGGDLDALPACAAG